MLLRFLLSLFVSPFKSKSRLEAENAALVCIGPGTTSSLRERAGLERARSISAWLNDYGDVLDL
jgi:hypothetical protein